MQLLWVENNLPIIKKKKENGRRMRHVLGHECAH